MSTTAPSLTNQEPITVEGIKATLKHLEDRFGSREFVSLFDPTLDYFKSLPLPELTTTPKRPPLPDGGRFFEWEEKDRGVLVRLGAVESEPWELHAYESYFIPLKFLPGPLPPITMTPV